MSLALLAHCKDETEIQDCLTELVNMVRQQLKSDVEEVQLSLFDHIDNEVCTTSDHILPVGKTVTSLWDLVESGQRFATIYADPPWEYENSASRGAAANHYPTMSVREICREPVASLAMDNGHLHLWTTSVSLRDAFEVIDAWGFQYKSGFVWGKLELGMGNYWRVSHEYLLLGVRGNLRFRDRTLPSWIEASRTLHSRKPGIVRCLIERASPGPYLEMYGREQLPDSAWTVYGNQIEPRLF